MRHLKTTLTALFVALVLVICADYASFAATGKSFVLGKINSANKQTTLTRTTNGPVLKLNAKQSSGVPLAVRGTGRVANLNADRIDGLDSSTLKTTARVFTTDVFVDDTSVEVPIPVANGNYLIDYSAFLLGAQSGNVRCFLEQDPIEGTSTYTAESRFTAGAVAPGLTGSGFMTKTSTNSLELHCSATNMFHTAGSQPIQVVATRIDAASSAQVVLPRTNQRSARH